MALQKSIRGRGGVGWMNCRAGTGEFSDWVINLTFVSQWEYNLALCELLLTKISVPHCVWTKRLTERSGEECEPVPTPTETRQIPVKVQHSGRCGEQSLCDRAARLYLIMRRVYNTCLPFRPGHCSTSAYPTERKHVLTDVSWAWPSFKHAWFKCKNTSDLPSQLPNSPLS